MNAGIDRRALARAADRAADNGAGSSLVVQAESELLSRLEFFALAPARILALGTGTARAAMALRERFGHAELVAMHRSVRVLAQAPRGRWWRTPVRRVVGEPEALPLASGSVDLVFSNLVLPGCAAPEVAIAEIARVLRPGGLLLLSTLGPDTLWELREAWRAADELGHVASFPDMPMLASLVMAHGFAEPVLDNDRLVHHYPDARTLLGALRLAGSTNASDGRRRSLTGRGRWSRLIAAYDGRREPAGLPATFEYVYGAAFRAEPRHRSEVVVPMPRPRGR